jgi:hypothetical protein
METETPQPQVLDEARRLASAALERDVPIRLVGGLAVRIRVDEAFHPGLSREYKDIDFVTRKGHSKQVARFFEDMGYEAQERFNAMNGHERLMFNDLANERRVDVFVGRFHMCHSIPINDRITVDPITLPLAELLLTKLQIVNLNEKDQRDVVAILHHHEIGDRDGDTINATRVAQLCAEDWGLWRTCKMNVERVREGLAHYDIAQGERAAVQERLDRLWERIEAEPKSRGWRLRDKIGDRRRWYEEPEEVDA